jgi:hypothetical protein
MTHYLSYTGLKKINNNICPPPPANKYIIHNNPKEFIVDDDGKKWIYTGERYNFWPVYTLDN